MKLSKRQQRIVDKLALPLLAVLLMTTMMHIGS
jgi:hypothetical protein